MQIFELLEIAVSLSNRLDTHWTLFITVHLALIGGIIYVDRPLQKSEKIAAIMVYTGFAVINYLMMLNQTNLLNSIYADIIALKNDPCCVDSSTMKHLVRMHEFGSFKTALWSIGLIHLAMYVLVILSILNDKARSKSTALLRRESNENEAQEENHD